MIEYRGNNKIPKHPNYPRKGIVPGGTRTPLEIRLSTLPSRPPTPCLSLVLSSKSIFVQINDLHLVHLPSAGRLNLARLCINSTHLREHICTEHLPLLYMMAPTIS